MSSEVVTARLRAGRAGSAVGSRVWRSAWPKLLAVVLVLAVWELVVLSGWKPEYLLPGPRTVLTALGREMGDAGFWQAVSVTLQRAVLGFGFALVVGTLAGLAVVQWRPLRMATASLLTGLQTMPSIAWFPLSILLFKLSEGAIFFVVVLGAAPSIANGIISGIDEVPPPLLRAGRMLGATGVSRYRHVVVPAAMPAYLAGLKQGWAFSWRSLMAGELLVYIPGRVGLGADLHLAQQFLHADTLLALMIVVLVIGMCVDWVFSTLTNGVRRRRGLTGAA